MAEADRDRYPGCAGVNVLAGGPSSLAVAFGGKPDRRFVRHIVGADPVASKEVHMKMVIVLAAAVLLVGLVQVVLAEPPGNAARERAAGAGTEAARRLEEPDWVRRELSLPGGRDLRVNGVRPRAIRQRGHLEGAPGRSAAHPGPDL